MTLTNLVLIEKCWKTFLHPLSSRVRSTLKASAWVLGPGKEGQEETWVPQAAEPAARFSSKTAAPLMDWQEAW